MAELTKTQRQVLAELVKKPRAGRASLPSERRLIELGSAQQVNRPPFGNPWIYATEAGRAALTAQPT